VKRVAKEGGKVFPKDIGHRERRGGGRTNGMKENRNEKWNK